MYGKPETVGIKEIMMKMLICDQMPVGSRFRTGRVQAEHSCSIHL
jgi:hypothetical protein